ncbi:endonuclease domain-containing 1 protein-like [Neoarius graeffei]|uniref:endonuclease domain-containing 1 protein-like n=1 Tax=Neoarius graeffei TaxID=443677 RepID=UPI00298CF131|nr:endonuclease domain-containing 1 protein-like [Neoarius graeffei]XP_060774060.1 endonuclease domain-containing 1 protein-like [Neoarius graeffei]
MKLLALVLLLATFSSPILTEVVEAFNKNTCSDSFIHIKKDIITPTIFKGYQYKKICQRWANAYRFATLYDTQQRIPVYSAYRFTGQQDTIRNEEWKNEPELENIKSPEMTVISPAEMDKFFHQAVNRDYAESQRTTGTEYTRGHVFPRQYATNQDQADSTFAFTNVAPQTQHSNGEWAERVETPMMRVINQQCRPDNNNPTYIVTGVVPGNKWIPITREVKEKRETIQNGVNIPSYYWTAFCCHNHQNERISMAYLTLQNEPNERTFEFSQMSVNRLNIQLTRLYKQEFSVFGTLCLN